LTAGIFLRAGLAFVGRAGRLLGLAFVDFVLVDVALLVAGFLYRGRWFAFPSYAYPVVYVVPPAILVMVLFLGGAYAANRHSMFRTLTSVLIGYTLISAVVFFAKEFAFSRAIVLIAGCISLVVLPCWRFGLLLFGRMVARGSKRGSLFGNKTLIVGTGPSAQQVMRKLRTRVDGGYDVLGFIATNRRQIGEKVAGLDVVGSLDNVGKVIIERKVSEVIFSMDSISYADILSVIAKSNDRGVNYRLVPNSLEAIIGKTRIEELDTLPLVEIEYNLHKMGNRILKRSFDILCSFGLLVTVYPFLWIWRRLSSGSPLGMFGSRMLLLPQVFSGTISFVGLPLSEVKYTPAESESSEASSYLGPRGLTGLVQINAGENLDAEEIERFTLYYAKNYSLGLDVEILFKALLQLLKE
ncbi:MAG TPA: hypothetical protein DGH68_08550, partial [Bacteroidetes bacterium]|nr:hypothetical protein [Bacteroidota bacterium]